MASELDQFAELELSKEDREQIFDPPLDRQQMEGAGTSRYLLTFPTYLHTYVHLFYTTHLISLFIPCLISVVSVDAYNFFGSYFVVLWILFVFLSFFFGFIFSIICFFNVYFELLLLNFWLKKIEIGVLWLNEAN